MISLEALDALPLGKDVYDDITYCLQQWQEAGYKAVMALPDPDSSSSNVDWAISLIGNMAWAATVFFPPAFVGATAGRIAYAAASTATKVVSVLGAAVGSGTVAKLRELGGKLNSPVGKRFLSDYLGIQVPDMLKEYAKDADAWVKQHLRHYLAGWYYSLRGKVDDKNEDAAFTALYNSVRGAEQRRKYVWETYVFPSTGTLYNNTPMDDGSSLEGGQLGLQKMIYKNPEKALKDFDRQWEAFDAGVQRWKAIHSMRDMRGGGTVEQFIKANPFNPVLKYEGLPPKLLAQQEANRKRLRDKVKQLG